MNLNKYRTMTNHIKYIKDKLVYNINILVIKKLKKKINNNYEI